MKNRYISSILISTIIVLLVGVNAFWISNYKKANRATLYAEISKEELKDRNSELKEFIQESSEREFDLGFPTQDLFVLNANGDTLLLPQLLGNKEEVLIYYFSELGCSTCFDKVLKLINKYSKTFEDHNILYLAYGTNRRYSSVVRRMNKINAEIYNVKGSNFFNGYGEEVLTQSLLFKYSCGQLHKPLKVEMKNISLIEYYIESYFSRGIKPIKTKTATRGD